MYNDYYLEQINNKLQDTNINLQEVIENQEKLISGDKEIVSQLINLQQGNVALMFCLLLTLIYTFIKGCFRC